MEPPAAATESEGFVVLLTACIAPKPGIRERLKRCDPVTREQDYAAALRFWLELDEPRIPGIVFADNSGHPLDRLRAVAEASRTAARPVEFLSWDYPAPPATISYGHPEFQLVQAALRASVLLPRHRYFIKATGRYQFPDVSRLLRRLPRDFRVAVDSRDMGWLRRGRNMMATTALALFERRFYLQELIDLPDRMAEAPPWNRLQFIEAVLYDALAPRAGEPGIILRWPCNCEPVGYGANGKVLDRPGRRLRAAIRAIGRVVLPRVWI